MNQASRNQDNIEPLPVMTSGSTSKATFAARKKQALSTTNMQTAFQSRKLNFHLNSIKTDLIIIYTILS